MTNVIGRIRPELHVVKLIKDELARRKAARIKTTFCGDRDVYCELGVLEPAWEYQRTGRVTGRCYGLSIEHCQPNEYYVGLDHIGRLLGVLGEGDQVIYGADRAAVAIEVNFEGMTPGEGYLAKVGYDTVCAELVVAV